MNYRALLLAVSIAGTILALVTPAGADTKENRSLRPVVAYTTAVTQTPIVPTATPCKNVCPITHVCLDRK